MLYHNKLLRAELYDDSTYPYTDVKQVWEANNGKHPGKLVVTNAHWHDPGPAYCGNYKVGGKVLSNQYGSLAGFGWKTGDVPRIAWYMDGLDYYVSTIPALISGKRQNLSYGAGVERATTRTWFGCTADGEWYVEVTTDNYTLDGIVDRMEALGIVDGMVLDSGGSSQWYDGHTYINGDGRTIYSYLLCWFEEKPKEDEPITVYQQMATKNKCYITGRKITPCGVMVHSTGANNPNLKRYVQPDDGKLGTNPYANSMNEYLPGGRSVCPHAFIGKLADGTIAAYQILPWEMEGWHAGGAANKLGYIGFEICEDGLNNAAYFKAVYNEAVALTAYLCEMFGFDPQGKTAQGYPTVLCHSEGNKYGIATNHADVTHWFPRFGKTMDDFRTDVARRMETIQDYTGEDEMVTYEQIKPFIEQFIQERRERPGSTWSAGDRDWAVATGLFEGSDTGFMWQDSITREQNAAVMHRLYNAIKSELK